jgi:hypothetical protein
MDLPPDVFYAKTIEQPGDLIIIRYTFADLDHLRKILY